MKRLKFDWLMLILTVVLALAGAAGVMLFYDSMRAAFVGRIIWCGLFFTVPLLFSLAGVTIATAIHSRKYIMHKKGNRVVSFILAFVFAAIIGAGGEALYMLKIDATEPEPEPTPIVTAEPTTAPTAAPTAEPEPEPTADGMDVSLIIDYSYSMYDYSEDCKNAACTLVEELDEQTYLQYITYSNIILDNTELVQLDDSGKEAMTELIQNTNHLGGLTKINEPMSAAYEALTSSDSGNERKAVILISDATWSDGGDLQDDTKQAYIDNEIPVYLISIETSDLDLSKLTEFTEFAEATGGFETVLDGNDTDYDKIIEALRTAYTASPEPSTAPSVEPSAEPSAEAATQSPKEVNSGTQKEYSVSFDDEVFLPFGYDGIVRTLIRLIMFILYGLLASAVIYYNFSLRELKNAAIMGAIATLAVTILGNFGSAGRCISVCVIAVLYWAAITFYHPSRGEDEDV